MTKYSFSLDHIGEPYECPCCGADLKGEDAVSVSTPCFDAGAEFLTSVNAVGVIADIGVEDADLVLTDAMPDICCVVCKERLCFDATPE